MIWPRLLLKLFIESSVQSLYSSLPGFSLFRSALPGLGDWPAVPCCLVDKAARRSGTPPPCLPTAPSAGKGFTPQLLASGRVLGPHPSCLVVLPLRDFHPSSLDPYCGLLGLALRLTPRTLQATPVGNPAAQAAHRYSEPQMPLVCQAGMSQGHL